MSGLQKNYLSLIITLGIVLFAAQFIEPKNLSELIPYENNNQIAKNYKAVLKVDLRNLWKDKQIAYVENLTGGPAPEPRTIEYPISVQQREVSYYAVTPKTRIHFTNFFNYTVTLRPALLSNQAAMAYSPIGIAAKDALEFLPEKFFRRFGDIAGIYNDSSNRLMIVMVYLPHEYYLYGYDMRKTFRFPNQQVRWRWLRFIENPDLPHGVEVLSTTHKILVNQGKILHLTFETPLRK